MVLNSTVRVLKSLSDATRLRLLQLLTAEELNVAEMCAVLGQPQPTVSRHLAVLRKAGMLTDRRDGQWVYYSTAADTLEPGVRSAWLALAADLDKTADARRDREKLARVLRKRHEAGRRLLEKEGALPGTRQSRFGDLVPWRSLAGLLPRNSVIVDLGTGTGDLLPALAPRAGQVVALDFSARVLGVARDRSLAAGLDNVAFVQGELESAPLSSGIADGVVASLVLHHAARPPEAVREIGRLLKPGGRAVLVDFLPHREEWLQEEEGDVWLGFKPESVRGWFEDAGFRNVLIETGPPPARSGRRDRPGADRRLKKLSLLWVEAERNDTKPKTTAEATKSKISPKRTPTRRR